MVKLINKVLRTFKSKKGFSSIEIAIGLIVFIIAICGFIDVTSILRTLNTLSTQSSYIARTVGRQGGLKTSTPDNYEAGDYVNSNELYNNVKTSFNMSGIPDTQWSATIGGVPLTPTTNVRIYDFGEEIPINVKVSYKWRLISNFIPGEIVQSKDSTRIIVSSFKLRTGDIQSEYKN